MVDNNKANELNKLAGRIEEEIAGISKHKKLTIIFGVLSIIIILGYFSIMAKLARDALEPTGLAEVVSEQITNYLPEFRRDLEEVAKREIPNYIDAIMFKLTNESIPGLRLHLEDKLIAKADEAIIEIEKLLFEQVDMLLITQGDKIRTLAADLSSDKGTEAFENSLYEMLDEALSTPEIQEELIIYKLAFEQLDGILLYFSQDEFPLSDEDKTVRELIAVLRELLNRESYT